MSEGNRVSSLQQAQVGQQAVERQHVARDHGFAMVWVNAHRLSPSQAWCCGEKE